MKIKNLFKIFKETFVDWQADKAPRLGAALAFYSIFSLAPVLLISISIIGIFFSHETAQQTIIGSLGSISGEQGTKLLTTAMENTGKLNSNIFGLSIGIIFLIVAATGVVVQLKDALNVIVDTKKKKEGFIKTIKNRILSLGLIIGIGFLLLVSLVISAVLNVFMKYTVGFVEETILIQIVNIFFSFVVIAVLFSLIYKLLPDKKIEWKSVIPGSIVASVLFVIGKELIGIYISNSSVVSAYGVAGSLISILIWVYYSAQIVLFGAQFNETYKKSKE